MDTRIGGVVVEPSDSSLAQQSGPSREATGRLRTSHCIPNRASGARGGTGRRHLVARSTSCVDHTRSELARQGRTATAAAATLQSEESAKPSDILALQLPERRHVDYNRRRDTEDEALGPAGGCEEESAAVVPPSFGSRLWHAIRFIGLE